MYKRFLVVIAALALLLPARGVFAGTQDFSISSFTSDYYLSRDSGHVAELRVHESILAVFPNIDQNHGILRAIPQTYQNHSLELKVQKVTDDAGAAINYTTSEENNNLVLKIGDANKYVHGPQIYNIDYTMRGVSLNLADHEEFYWDVNGDQWQQQFGVVIARVHVPADLAGNLQDRKVCYTGAVGSKESNCTATVIDENGGKLFTFTSQLLQVGETLTAVLGFNKGTFADYTPSQGEIWKLAATIAGAVLLPLLALVYVIRRWFKRGRDVAAKTAIVPEYTPPKELSVLGSSEVLHEGFQPKAVSATIIDLAVRHYIKVYEVKADKMFAKASYEVELVKAPTDLGSHEKAVVDMLFTTSTVGERVNLDDLKTALAKSATALGKQVEADVTKAGYFTVSPYKAKLPLMVTGGVLLVLGFFGFSLSGGLMVIIGLSIGAMLAGVILMVGAQTMPARTAKGVEMRTYLRGVEMYMKLAEADRIKVLQSPHGELTEKIDVGNNTQLVKLYEKLLPYAMLFNIEKDWAEAMAPLYQQPPDWYAGNATFNAVWFASSLGAFSTASNAVFAPPSSSSSSGFGGGAGGGGGGGGGGGW